MHTTIIFLCYNINKFETYDVTKKGGCLWHW